MLLLCSGWVLMVHLPKSDRKNVSTKKKGEKVISICSNCIHIYYIMFYVVSVCHPIIPCYDIV